MGTEEHEYEASVELVDHDATRRVVETFEDVTFRITGTEIDDNADAIDVHAEHLEPRHDAVVELIADGEVLARVIQRSEKE